MHRHIGTQSKIKLRSSSRSQRSSKRNIVRRTEKLTTFQFDRYASEVWDKIAVSCGFNCSVVDSIWYSIFCGGDKYKEKVVRWMLKNDRLENRYIFVPICKSNHWTLLILCNLGEDFNSESKSPCMLFLDSLRIREENMEPEIRRFVSALYKKWKPELNDDDIANIPFKCPKVSQQKDGIQCGYYVLYYMYRFLMDSPIWFNIHKDYPGFLSKYWFKEDEYKLFYENNFNIFKASGSENKDDSAVQIKDEDKEDSEVQIIHVEDKVELEAHDEVIKLHTPASSSKKRKELEKPDGQQQSPITEQVRPRKSPRRTKQKMEEDDGQEQSPIQQQTVARVEKLESPCDSVMEQVRQRKSARRTKQKMEEDDRRRMTRGQKRKIESQANKKRVQCKKNQVKRNKPNKKEKRKLPDESDNSLEDETDGEDEPGNLIPKKIKIRARASTFSKVISQLSKAQKEWIQNAGFGDLLLFCMNKIPKKMAVNVLWYYDPYENVLHLKGPQVIRIKEDDVHDVLGFPKGNRDVVFAADKEKLDAWRSQFPEKIAPHKVTEKMVFSAMKKNQGC
ncbi:uncharacterized protein LOC108212533 [Daucus carota subsp. sativus]|uniref:uncharacterized protein LOC108212533 n=1 Tax=Daucus carota subsp. sativus TaxID=79200 RepID=UPI0030835F60